MRGEPRRPRPATAAECSHAGGVPLERELGSHGAQLRRGVGGAAQRVDRAGQRCWHEPHAERGEGAARGGLEPPSERRGRDVELLGGGSDELELLGPRRRPLQLGEERDEVLRRLSATSYS